MKKKTCSQIRRRFCIHDEKLMDDNNTVFQKKKPKICITSAEQAEDNLEYQFIYNNASECGAFIKFEDLKSFSLVVVSSAYYKWFIAVILRMLASDRKWDRTREELTANKTKPKGPLEE